MRLAFLVRQHQEELFLDLQDLACHRHRHHLRHHLLRR
jgi:hypothetical protein